MKFKKVVSAALAFAMAVTGIIGTNFTFAEDTDVLNDNNVNLEAEVLPYQDTSLSFEERAADLVSRMTLAEKVNQLGYNTSAIARLGVGKYRYWREALHGVGRQGKATSFPSSLAMSNTWDRDVIYKAADITSTEARAKTGTSDNRYDLSYWSPTINMARDPRWGRNEESYGEDPYLTSEYGIQFVNGMQGNDDKYLKSISTIKHFVANNCEGERRYGTSVMDEQTLRDYYTKAFQNIVEKANPGSLMSSYNATTVTRDGKLLYDYVPSSANKYTLTDLLRRNWGFSGYVTGDCGAVGLLNSTLAYKRTLFPDVEDLSTIPQSATVPFALVNGNDLDCGSGGDAFQSNAAQAVENNYMSEDAVDIAVYHAILTRMKTGEFDASTPYDNLIGKSNLLETDENVAVAEKAAEESWVLLKNDNNTLPLKSDGTVKKIALVGNLAGQAFLGGYSGEPEKTVSPYEGLKNIVAEKGMDTEINYLGDVADTTKLFNIKSVKLLDSKGATKVTVDLSKATATDAEVSGSVINNVKKNSSICIKGVNFKDVASVQVEVEPTADCPNGSIVVNYGSANQPVAYVPFGGSSNTITGEYTGASGGYNATADLYLGININAEFSVEKYKTQLDEADYIIAYGGTTLNDSDESRDRKSISLPANQSHVTEIATAYPDKTIVVMQTAGQIDVSPFEANSKAILWNCYNGQTQGTALAKILFGDVNPSGKLSTTWYDPKDLETLKINGDTEVDSKNPAIKWIRNDYSIRQRETRPENFPETFSDKFIGRTYQYYSGNAVYPFGYGLSYTNFEYSNAKVSKSSVDANEKFTVSVDVKNAGSVKGDEVVQLYVKSPNGDGVNLPLKQLKGFDRVTLEPNETKTVSIDVDAKELNFFDEKTTSIYVPAGEYTVMVGSDSKSAENNTVKLNITGSLNKELKNVTAVPTGIAIEGTVTPDGVAADVIKSVDPQLSVIMTDETFVDIKDNSDVTIDYVSSNPDVAVVENGVVRTATKEGTATITVSATINGVTKTTTFPVVSTLKAAVSAEERTNYKKSLDDAYNALNQANYSTKNWAYITKTYTDALKEVETEVDNDKLKADVETAVNTIKSIKVKPAEGTDIYTITKFTDTLYNEVEVEVQYNGDDYEPQATLIASVVDENGNIVRTTETALTDSGTYKLNDMFEDGEKIQIHIWNSFDKMMPYSKEYEHTYEAQELPNFMVYNFNSGDFDSYFDSQSGSELKSINGLSGYGGFGKATKKLSYTYTKNDGSTVNLTFGSCLKSGKGNMTTNSLFFKPFPGYSKCKVTVLMSIAAGRVQYLCQETSAGKTTELAKLTGEGEDKVGVLTAEVTDMTKPIYTWGAGANKYVLGIVVEYTK